ncbi:PREDICTED: E3 ubiquitin-protein ligase RHF2A-like [Lupinus angustifolius]|uniref:E3 ubiquitin-protein ligase RHF2A-like n=1 Tax=Lupinus angustifolius TaxID=3871 RepID=UPI00092FD6B4|nr:PREDICTED: E3 ubiquitin-protein ligase RHF2A-like [Lupinus angustifolius]
MCWQPIKLKDPSSQELFEAVEHERSLRDRPSRNAAIFHHPAFGDFDFQPLRMGDTDFEEQIIQHLAAAAMGRAHHLGRREGICEHIFVLRGFAAHSSPVNQDGAGPSEFQSFSDSLRSKLNAVSMRYKDSISKGTKGWKERLFSRTSSMPEFGSEARSEANVGIASVSRLVEFLQTRENNRVVGTSLSNHLEDRSIVDGSSNQNNVEGSRENFSHNNNTPAACSAGSHSS